jgi:selenocysteine lyase/cysteine desulfurase
MSEAVPKFNLGEDIRKEFLLDESILFVNHGSYGAVPKKVFQKRQALQAQIEKCPDIWFAWDLKTLYDENIAALAEFVGADPKNIAFVTNSTTGVNTVLKNLLLEPEDILLLNSHTYGACAKTVDCAVKRAGADIMSIDIILPIRSDEQLVDQLVEVCKRHAGIRLVIIDHISSPSAIVFPVEKIIRELHKLGVLVLVDGAHAPGQLELNLEKLGADFYTGNLHKWCFAPRGSAFLWVNQKHRDSIQPLVTSHNYKQDFTLQFFFQGTMDHSAYLCTKESLQFIRDCGGMKGIKDHTESLLDWAQQMLCHALGTSILPIPPSLQAPYMRVLRLPELKGFTSTSSEETAHTVMDQIKRNHNCIVAVTCFSGHLWLRISGTVYNTKEDYLALKDILLKMKCD